MILKAILHIDDDTEKLYGGGYKHYYKFVLPAAWYFYSA